MTFTEAIALFNNSRTEMSKALGVSKQVIYNWSKMEQIPDGRMWQIKGVVNERQNIQSSSD